MASKNVCLRLMGWVFRVLPERLRVIFAMGLLNRSSLPEEYEFFTMACKCARHCLCSSSALRWSSTPTHSPVLFLWGRRCNDLFQDRLAVTHREVKVLMQRVARHRQHGGISRSRAEHDTHLISAPRAKKVCSLAEAVRQSMLFGVFQVPQAPSRCLPPTLPPTLPPSRL